MHVVKTIFAPIKNYEKNVDELRIKDSEINEITLYATELLEKEDLTHKEIKYSLKIIHILPNDNDLKQRIFNKVFNIDSGKLWLFASEYDRLDLIKDCFSKNVDINLCDESGYTAIMLAAIEGNIEIIDFLIQKGASLNLLNINSDSALIIACQENNVEAAKLILQNLSSDDLKSSVTKDAIKDLLNDSNLSIEIIEILLQKAEISPLALYAGSNALNNKKLDILEYILKSNCDLNAILPNCEGTNLLMRASQIGDKTSVELICKYSKNFDFANERGSTALMFAAENGHADIVEFLVNNGANPNIQNKHGMTPLLYAASKGHSGIVEFLVKNGAKLDFQNDLGGTAIHYSITENHSTITNFLFENGAKLNTEFTAPMCYGKSPYLDLKKNRPAGHKTIVKSIKIAHPDIKKTSDVITALIRIYHVLELQASHVLKAPTAQFQNREIDLQGYGNYGWFKFMIKNTDKIINNGDFQFIPVKEMLEFTLNLLDYDSNKILERIQNGLPTLIPSGWSTHAVTILFTKERGNEINLMICHRGKKSEPQRDKIYIDVRRLDMSSLTIDAIKTLLNPRSIEGQFGFDAIINEMSSSLKFQKSYLTDLMQKYSPFKDQLSDNCTWASPETAIFALLISKQMNDLAEKFKLTKYLFDNSSVVKDQIAPTLCNIQEIFNKNSHIFLKWVFNARVDSIDVYLEKIRLMDARPDVTFLNKAIFEMHTNSLRDLDSHKLFQEEDLIKIITDAQTRLNLQLSGIPKIDQIKKTSKRARRNNVVK